MLDSLRQDLAYAARRLAKSPGFTLVAALTLALGIGATSAIFSVVNAVLLRPLPFPEPERLVEVDQVWKGKPVAYYSPQNFLDVEAQAKSFERLAAMDTRRRHAHRARRAATRLEGATVSAGFFDVLRVRPALGRGFVAGENEPGRDKVVVLGHKLWQDRFGGDPGIVGRAIEIDREPRTVVGVAPPGFGYPEGTEIWLPLQYDEIFRTHSRGAWYLNVVGRLAPGARVEGARRGSRDDRGAAREGLPGPQRRRRRHGALAARGHWSATRARRSWCCSARSAWCCSWPASTSPTCCSRASAAARASSPCARRSAPDAAASCGQLFTESVLLALVGGASACCSRASPWTRCWRCSPRTCHGSPRCASTAAFSPSPPFSRSSRASSSGRCPRSR